LKCHVFKYDLIGLSFWDASAKTELKTNRNSKFYAWDEKINTSHLSGMHDRAPYRHGPCVVSS